MCVMDLYTCNYYNFMNRPFEPLKFHLYFIHQNTFRFIFNLFNYHFQY